MELPHAFTELGLNRQATASQAKAAYRSLAMRWHPDLSSSPDAEIRMKTINVAYEAVSAHLTLREHAAAAAKPQPAASRPATGAATAKGASTGSGVSPGFSEFDWQAGFTAAAGAGGRYEKPVQHTVQVSLLEAAFGCVKCIRGSATDAWSLYVRIHAGTGDGVEVAPGDIRIYAAVHALPRAFKLSVQIDKHPLFQLDRERLSVSVPISIWRWVLGGEITVPTLDGTARVHLPPRAGAVLLKNEGWPQFKQAQHRGPLFVMPQRLAPDKLSEYDKRLLRALDAGVRLPEVAGWNQRVQAWMQSTAQGVAVA